MCGKRFGGERMLTKEISEVEKGCGERLGILNGMWICGEEPKKGIVKLCPICQAKLSALKSAQAKFDKFMIELKPLCSGIEIWFNGLSKPEGYYDLWKEIEKIKDELSSKQEGKE
jgi:hypothetical protein